MDEDGKEYDVKYLANKNGLSGGWRGFAIDHKLSDGDAVVFQLIEPLKLKVNPILCVFYTTLALVHVYTVDHVHD